VSLILLQNVYVNGMAASWSGGGALVGTLVVQAVQVRHEYPIPHLAHWRCFIEIFARLPVFRV